MASKRFLLIDSNAILHRAFHALPLLTTKEGQPINAVYGFTSILLKAISTLKPGYIAAAFDRKEPTFRHKEFADYKAHRPALPSELTRQIPKVKEILTAFKIPIYEKEGYEADDILGTLVEKLSPKGFSIIILTGDLDTLQLVNATTKVYLLRKGISETQIFDEKEIQKRYNLNPQQLIDFKALKGDPSDNIPGVPGIGEKSALELIRKFGSLEELYKKIEENKINNQLPEKTIQLLKNYKEAAFLSKKLVTIQKNVDIDFDEADCVFGNFDYNEIFNTFQKYGFKSLLARIPQNKPQSLPLFENPNSTLELKHTGTNYKIIQNQEEFEELIKRLSEQKLFSFDIEATSKKPDEAEIVGISFSFKEKEAFYCPFNHRKEKNLSLEKNLPLLKEILENPQIQKCGHNLKYDYGVLLNYGIETKGIVFDSMVAAYLLMPNLKAYSLDALAFSELGIQTTPLEHIIGKNKNAKEIQDIPINILGPYSCEDADIAFRLFQYLDPQIKEKRLEKVLYEIEIPLIPVLAHMENWGVNLDINYLKEISQNISQEILQTQEAIFKEIGWHFNLNSPQQLSFALFEVLKLPKENVKKTKTGISTSADQLEKIKNLHPAIELILKYRELVKIKNTYIDVLPTLINPKTNRLHTNFNQTITATGRLSSSNPNLQNIPATGIWGEKIRKAFVAEPGNILLSADYSQIELRIAAALAEDERMLMAFENDEDIHTATAMEIFGLPANQITKEMRRTAKTINFGILYGMSSYGLSEALGIAPQQANEYIEKYFTLHQGIQKYIRNTIEKARELGYVETYFGRKRPIPEINSNIINIRNAAERMAINMPIQGTAADIIKLAMIEIFKELKEKSYPGKMILQVHDELVFEVPKNNLKEFAKMVKDKMENIVKLTVPLKVNLKWGKNWSEMEELEV